MQLTRSNRIRPRLLAAGLAITLAGEAAAHVNLVAPNGGETLPVGTTFTVEWTVVIQHATVDWDLWYSTTGPGGPWIPIAMDLPLGDPSAGSIHTYDWTVPEALSSSVRLRVRQDNSGMDYYDVSDGDLAIVVGASYCAAATNSTGAPAALGVGGSNTVAAGDLTLTATGVPANEFGYFLCSLTQGLSSPPGSSGNLCLGGSIGRFNAQVQNSGSAGSFSIAVDLTAMPVNPPVPVLAGETWSFQGWFRDGVTDSNFTDGVAVVFL